jgi:hypothetical protein
MTWLGRWTAGVYPMWRWSRTEHEYWTRWCIGCVYVLRGRRERAR